MNEGRMLAVKPRQLTCPLDSVKFLAPCVAPDFQTSCQPTVARSSRPSLQPTKHIYIELKRNYYYYYKIVHEVHTI